MSFRTSCATSVTSSSFAIYSENAGETSTELSEYDAVINEARAQLTTPPPHSASTFATACEP